jgi:hypothetical protein
MQGYSNFSICAPLSQLGVSRIGAECGATVRGMMAMECPLVAQSGRSYANSIPECLSVWNQAREGASSRLSGNFLATLIRWPSVCMLTGLCSPGSRQLSMPLAIECGVKQGRSSPGAVRFEFPDLSFL